MSQASSFGVSWQGSLSDLANIIQNVKRSKAFGRLSLRNLEHISIAHLYYRAGQLVHIVGNCGDARTVLLDLKNWSYASVRFERGKSVPDTGSSQEYEALIDEVLAYLYRKGVVVAPQIQAPTTRPLPNFQQPQPQSSQYTQPRRAIIESDLVAASEPKQLITPAEWRILIEATRRVSLAVAHLVGPNEALKVLRDILDDCSSSFPAFIFFKISPNGYLQVADPAHLDRLSRDELIEGFTALIAICQHFCTPIIGERDAHLLILQALQELTPPLASLGVFRVNTFLLTDNNF